GSVPSLIGHFPGCRFASRCEYAWADCTAQAPRVVATETGRVRCHLFDPRFAARAPKAAAVPAPRAPPAAQPVVDQTPLLEVRDLQVHFTIRRGVFKRTVGHVYAVDGVSLSLSPGRTLALVGESGCGKTTLGQALLRLQRPTGGEVRFDGTDMARLGG